MDPAAYGILNVSQRKAQIKLRIGTEVCLPRLEVFFTNFSKERETKVVYCPTLDPTWEETFSFPVDDPSTAELVTSFYLGNIKIGQDCSFNLSGLFQSKSTFKGMPVVGGKIDFLLRAIDFGEIENKADDDFDVFDMM
eukprot:TRINITY_DN3725_c0_g1_i7.p1 TRINITY_DN3725_c0_g1~~TRINITY_DN3725_c0_g1_i7.p1  ORF type:complete len:138 (+),score=10.97 TRINITY_DN3725_c0_g1_i7:164-577(+)